MGLPVPKRLAYCAAVLDKIHSLRWLTITLLAFASRLQSAQLVDDRAITIHSTREVAEKRAALIKYLWGETGFPKQRIPEIIQTNIPSPVKELTHLARVDEFRMDLAPGLQALTYHFIPTEPNRE